MPKAALPAIRLDAETWLYQGIFDRPSLREAAARRHLAGILGCPEDQIRLSRDQYGKPRLAAPHGGLDFSLARRGGVLVIATTRSGTVGVDMEQIGQCDNCDGVARDFFAPAEAQWLVTLPRPERRRGFAALWTAKEAVLKARGQGIAAGLSNPDLSPWLEDGKPLCLSPLQLQSGGDTYTLVWYTRPLEGDSVMVARAQGLPASPFNP
ncbi:Phosphopantetheinyl transferase [Candidatus Terasakiella magnetica]|nr:Phosphopantetheinyl transferase [Candidatus Terasakiella magnetica]